MLGIIGGHIGFSTSLDKADNTLTVRFWIWKLCVEITLNIFLDEDRNGKPDRRRR